jgi:hypothetical protein
MDQGRDHLCEQTGDVGAAVSHENRPDPNATLDGWGHMLHRFAKPIDLAAGGRVQLCGQHNRRTLLIRDLTDSG